MMQSIIIDFFLLTWSCLRFNILDIISNSYIIVNNLFKTITKNKRTVYLFSDFSIATIAKEHSRRFFVNSQPIAYWASGFPAY